jgi:dolichol-phosphate mannosyltransferase
MTPMVPAALIVAAQALAAGLLLARLLPGARRRPPVTPLIGGLTDTTVTTLVPTLDEAGRIGPLLRGLEAQGAPLLEAIVIDSGSRDATADLVRDAAARDGRLRLTRDPPRPPGWVGKVWALEYGLSQAQGEWVLGIDADVEPLPGLVAGVVDAARREGLDVVSFSPRFAGQSRGERFLQPALLMTLIYRFGAPSARPRAGRVLANGQCFLSRRDVLLAHGGYAPARGSFADDVMLARHLAHRGARVGFLDGSRLFRVRSYRSAAELWREWGRSIDLADTTPRLRQWLDLLFLCLVQALPLPILLVAAAGGTGWMGEWVGAIIGLNGALIAIRLGMMAATAGAYERRGFPWALSWVADVPAVARVILSSLRRPRRWRGREYAIVP